MTGCGSIPQPIENKSGNYMARLQFGYAGTQGALLEDEFGEIGL